MSRRHNEHNESLTGEHRLGDAGQIVFALLFLAAWSADTFVFHVSTFLNATVPALLRIPAGIALLALSGYLSLTGLAIVFGEKREEPEVIRKSVFGRVRHPIYLGELLLYAALLMFSLSLAAAAIALIAFLFLHFISRHEEKLLLRRFGGEYETYMREVPMWFPRPRPVAEKKGGRQNGRPPKIETDRGDRDGAAH
jgi:protein-S-isoprenylcysteine O-methyltransferase Ste14